MFRPTRSGRRPDSVFRRIPAYFIDIGLPKPWARVNPNQDLATVQETNSPVATDFAIRNVAILDIHRGVVLAQEMIEFVLVKLPSMKVSN